MPIEPISSVSRFSIDPIIEYRKHQKEPILLHTKDSISAHDEEEDIRKLRPELVPSFGIPKLTAPSPIITDEENFAIDSNLEHAIFVEKNAYRDSLGDNYKQVIQEVRRKQLQQKKLHEERDQLLKELEERAKTSEVLRWVQGGAGIGMLILGVLACAVATIITGGLGILGVVGAVAGGVGGVMQGTNGLLGLSTEEMRGHADKLKALSEVEHGTVSSLLSRSGATVNKIHNHNDLCAKDERNRFGVKIF